MYQIVNITGAFEYAKEIYDIESSCFPNEKWSFDSIYDELKNGKSIYLIFIYDDKIAGYLNAYPSYDEIELMRIAILPQHQNNGFGMQLIDYLKEYSLNENLKRIILEVRSRNKGAINLYTKCGFKQDGVRKKYYINPTDDAILMSCGL